MKLCSYGTLIALILAVAGTGVCEDGGAVQKPIQLFNGKNLDGFYSFLDENGKNNDPKGVFTVSDGVLRISGEEFGCITTEKEYSDYHLVAEFRWGGATFPPRVDRARDSGILLHSVGEDGAYGGVWMFSIECQIIEGGTGDLLVVGDQSEAYALTSPVADEKQGNCNVYKKGGKPATIYAGRINWYGRDPGWEDVINFRGKEDVEKPVGEWNRVECIVEGDKITIILNGVTVNECFDVRPRKGKIQIQSEGAEILFRRIDLLPLKRP